MLSAAIFFIRGQKEAVSFAIGFPLFILIMDLLKEQADCRWTFHLIILFALYVNTSSLTPKALNSVFPKFLFKRSPSVDGLRKNDAKAMEKILS